MGVISRRSIRTKAPLAAVALILLVVATLSTASIVVLRRTLHDNAAERLRTLADQLGETFRTNTVALRTRTTGLASRPEIAAYLANPSTVSEAAAIAALAPVGPQPELSLAVEVRDQSGRVRLASPASADTAKIIGQADTADLSGLVAAASASDTGAALGRLRQSGDIIFYPTVARVPGHADAFIVNWRRIGNSAQARTQLARILGSEAAFFFGNADGTIWSELGQPALPPAAAPVGQAFEFTRPGRETVIGVRGAIESTSWAYSLEFPAHVVEAPARAFMWTMSSIAAGCLIVGGLAAWWLSRRVAVPIETLREAADAIAAGRTEQRVQLCREDELGRLGAAFNVMAAEVEAVRRHLEEAVEKRTGELRSAQESLARREKLALIGHLASGVGHEIRNPLGVMANAVYYLETVQADASPQVRQYLGILRQQIQLCAKIVNDLLDLSRATPVKRERVGVNRLVDERLQRIESGAAFVADIPHDLPAVAVDPVHAGQVLDNLLSNAVQAMNGSPGTVSVRARATGDGFVCLEVSDTGPGISQEHFSKVFEPLFTTKARGIGLGLALSKSLAQANGGDLALVSAPNQSATFAFILPVAEGSA